MFENVKSQTSQRISSQTHKQGSFEKEIPVFRLEWNIGISGDIAVGV